MDQKEEIVVTAEKSGKNIHIKITSDRNYTIRLVNVAIISTEAEKDGNDTILTLSGNTDIIVTEA